eukprot:6193356-Pleurochrysis_carterae.AAC.2
MMPVCGFHIIHIRKQTNVLNMPLDMSMASVCSHQRAPLARSAKLSAAGVCPNYFRHQNKKTPSTAVCSHASVCVLKVALQREGAGIHARGHRIDQPQPAAFRTDVCKSVMHWYHGGSVCRSVTNTVSAVRTRHSNLQQMQSLCSKGLAAYPSGTISCTRLAAAQSAPP